MRRDPLSFFIEMTHTYGDRVFFDAPGHPAYLLAGPEDIRHILQENSAGYSKDTLQYRSLAKITGSGLLTSDRKLWQHQHRLEQPAFSEQRLAALDPMIVPAVEAMLDRWEQYTGSDEPLDVDAEMARLSLEIVGKAMLSSDLTDDAHKLTQAMRTCLDFAADQVRRPIQWGDFWITPRKAKFLSALSTLNLAAYDWIAARREAANYGDDLLGMLLKAIDIETGAPLTDEQIRDEIMTILVAGCETLASALTSSWYLLAQNPAAWEQMRAEVQTALGRRIPIHQDLAALAYTRQVFSEVLRLYPPVWQITRKAISSDRFGDYSLPAGAEVMISPYVVQHSPAYWTDPETFRPERFAPGQPEPVSGAYIPFGMGPRACIGCEFAIHQARMVLAMAAQRYRLEMIPDRSVIFDARATLRPRYGLPMHVCSV
jgi:cytochrome P450